MSARGEDEEASVCRSETKWQGMEGWRGKLVGWGAMGVTRGRGKRHENAQGWGRQGNGEQKEKGGK